MADVKMNANYGNPQVELNQVAFRRDGRIEAQCKLDTTDFASTPAYNGTILAIDNINRVVKNPTSTSTLFGLNYTSEHIYDDRTPGLKNFALEAGSFCPRLGYLEKGDKFTTNAVVYNNASSYTPVAGSLGYVKAGDAGFIRVVAAGTTISDAITGAPTFVVAAVTTMPDGAPALKLQVTAE